MSDPDIKKRTKSENTDMGQRPNTHCRLWPLIVRIGHRCRATAAPKRLALGEAVGWGRVGWGDVGKYTYHDAKVNDDHGISSTKYFQIRQLRVRPLERSILIFANCVATRQKLTDIPVQKGNKRLASFSSSMKRPVSSMCADRSKPSTLPAVGNCFARYLLDETTQGGGRLAHPINVTSSP